MSKANLLFEIGTEEIPARLIPIFEKELALFFPAQLEENLLSSSTYHIIATPRRIGIYSKDIPTIQNTKKEFILGPPLSVAKMQDGSPSKALEAFCKNHNITIDDSFEHSNEKGTYMAAHVLTGGNNAIDILSILCENTIKRLASIQKMRWNIYNDTFARPIRWICALFGENIIPVHYANCSSGNITYGHRVYAKTPITIPAADSYLTLIQEKGFVTPSTEERKQCIREHIHSVENTLHATVIHSNSLLEENACLVEFPHTILGTVEKEFLELPKEVFLTSIEQHQKSFGIEDSSGALLPYFLSVVNIDPQNAPLVQQGWEKVLRARLHDALFFYKKDIPIPLETWVENLANVTFIAPLGTMKEKALRLKDIAYFLAKDICPENAQKASRAAFLSKADLVSAMVGEFDTLQGIMGGIYAKAHGEDNDIATAIAEHYLPVGTKSPTPKSTLGAIVSLADKIDTLVGCFGLGKMPTGTADMHGLRRAILAIFRIIVEHTLSIDIPSLVRYARSLYGERKWKLSEEELVSAISQFYFVRIKHYYVSHGFDTPIVEAVLAAKDSSPITIQKRLEALSTASTDDSFIHIV
ncbi:MAG: glycine--tRNA ligase subunit beta, partial [Desulfovibrionaceae bacterium]